MKTLFYTLTSAMLLIAAGCTYTVQELEAELTSLTVSPKYFCSGETATFSFEGLAVDSVSINKSDQTLLLGMIRPPQSETWYGSGDTPPMKKEWLPLNVSFHSNSNDEDYPFPFPGNKFVNIDQEQWAGIYQDTVELAGTPYLEHVGNTQEYDNASGSVITVSLYDVKQDFYGFRWTIPYEFGDRATLQKIMNLGQKTMKFTISGVQGEYQLAPNQMTAPLPIFKHPAGVIEARYDPPEPRVVGKQKGEKTKPANEHYSYQDLSVRHVSPMNLMVRCRDM